MFATATIGVLAGAGYLLVATVATGLTLLALEIEIRYLPFVSSLDSRRYVGLFRNDDEPPGAPRPPRDTGPADTQSSRPL